jgi:signal peptidase I
VVAFDTADGSKLAVKRVIGLPGEQVAIRGGEVYLNGQLWQKTLPEHRQLSMLVMTRDAQSVSSTDGQDTFAWQTCVPTVTDVDHYNPAVNRPAFDVSDVRVVAGVWPAEGATFACRLHDGWQAWRIELDGPTGAVKLFQGDHVVATGQVSPTAGTGYSWEAAVVDRQVFVRVNDEVIVQHGFAASQGPPSFKRPRVAFGAQGGKVRLTEISVYRDIYWLDPVGLSGRWESNRPLAAGEYFVLGDNVPVSTDSRHFGAVKREQLRGLVRRWPLNDR